MRRFLWPSVVLAVVIAYPLIFTTPFQQRLGALVLLYAIIASAWNIVGGYAGQVSVGHVVFFGCGAYAAMGVYAHFGLSPLVGIPVGIIVSVLIAAVIGVPTLRLSGHYFSMATIAVSELVRLIVTNTTYLGAAVGLSGPTVPRNVFDVSFISALPYYYLFLATLAITLGITWWMTASRMGFYLRAIRDSERAARSLGAPASRVKLYAFMLSAGLTSVGGALYAQSTIHRRFDGSAFVAHNEVGGIIIVVVASLYAVLLGFMTVVAWEHFQESRDIVVVEADACIDAWHTAVGLPAPVRQQVRRDMTAYADIMVSQEWSAMKRGGSVPSAAMISMDAMNAVGGFVPENWGEANAQSA